MKPDYHVAAIRCLIYAAECRLAGALDSAADWLCHARTFNRMKRYDR